MDDPYLKRLLDTVARDLWEFDQPIHFAILPLDEKMLVSIADAASPEGDPRMEGRNLSVMLVPTKAPGHSAPAAPQKEPQQKEPQKEVKEQKETS